MLTQNTLKQRSEQRRSLLCWTQSPWEAVSIGQKTKVSRFELWSAECQWCCCRMRRISLFCFHAKLPVICPSVRNLKGSFNRKKPLSFWVNLSSDLLFWCLVMKQWGICDNESRPPKNTPPPVWSIWGFWASKQCLFCSEQYWLDGSITGKFDPQMLFWLEHKEV